MKLVFTQGEIAAGVKNGAISNRFVLAYIFMALFVFSVFETPPVYVIGLTNGEVMDWERLAIWLGCAGFWLWRITALSSSSDVAVFKVLACNLLPLSVCYGVVGVLLGGGWGFVLGLLDRFSVDSVIVGNLGACVVLLLLYNFFFIYLYRAVASYCELE